MKIIFMGSPDFAIPTLEKLGKSQNHKVIAVYTQPPKPALRGLEMLKSKVHLKADELNIPVYTPKSLKDKTEQEILRNLNADCIIVAAYGLLLPKEILEATKFGCINIHPSKLPRWRGAAPIQRAIMAGDSETSICIMKMEEGLDCGDIYLEKLYPIPNSANAGFMHNLLAEEGADLLLQVIDDIEYYSKNIRKQSEEGLIYAKKILASEEEIDFTKNCEEIYNKIRGLSPYPAAFFIKDNIKYKIYEAFYEISKSQDSRDFIIENNLLKIKCADGYIMPKIIQKEGKKRMNITEFLRGNKII